MLQPAPNGGVVDLQAAFLQKPFHIPKRQGVPKVPAHRAENQDGFGLPPLEDRRSGCHFRVPSGYQPSCSRKLQHILLKWEEEEQHSIWSTVRLGLSTALLMLGAWLLYAQQDIFQLGI